MFYGLISVVLILCTFATIQGVKCPAPKDVYKKVLKCEHKGGDNQTNYHGSLILRTIVRRYSCASRNPVKKCLTRLINKCANKTEHRVASYGLKKLVQLRQYGRTNQYYCTNKQVLGSHLGCLANATRSRPLASCMRKAYESMRKAISGRQLAVWTETKKQFRLVFPHICKYRMARGRCIRRAIERSDCDDSAGAVFINIMYAGIPRDCRLVGKIPKSRGG